jgi:hypothetical protein
MGFGCKHANESNREKPRFYLLFLILLYDLEHFAILNQSCSLASLFVEGNKYLMKKGEKKLKSSRASN